MFPKVTITIDMKAVLARLERLGDIKRLDPLGRMTADRLTKVFKKHTPISQDSSNAAHGKLQEGWEGGYKIDAAKARLLIMVKNIDPRAPKIWPMLMTGTRAHPIQAIRARLLSFRFSDGGSFVGPRVMHPGSKPAVNADQLHREVGAEIVNLKKRILELLVSDKTIVSEL